MTRINAFRTIAETRFVSWGNSTSALVFAAVLIICSVTVGCSNNEKPKPVTSNNQIPVAAQQNQPASMPTQPATAVSKPSPKKVAPKKAATVNYTDKTYGLTFEYPRRYAIETGAAAADLVLSHPIPMNFVQPGGVPLAAVELPETSFANTDFSSAFFNVSVHKSLTADQCTEFAVPQPKPMATATATASSTDSAPKLESQPASKQSATAQPAPTSGSKLMLGDLELQATEAVSGEGTRQSDSKYFHVFQDGSCYEFALNVTTVASEDGLTKHVDRDKVFDRLEKILATVKINPVVAPEVAAETPAPTPAETPAQ